MICYSGHTRAKKEETKRETTNLGGKHVDGKDLKAQKAVTHLVSASADTAKYHHATASKDTKAVRSEWLADCAKEMAIQDGSDYRVSEFTSMVVCTAGYGMAQPPPTLPLFPAIGPSL
jgi:hypothetical protein